MTGFTGTYFTILVNYNSSYIELLLNDVCLTNLSEEFLTASKESESYDTTDGQSASLPWNKAHILGLRPDIYYSLTITVLFLWGALSDERTGLSSVYAAGSRQRSPSWVRVPLVS
jgi:hypothetical protein